VTMLIIKEQIWGFKGNECFTIFCCILKADLKLESEHLYVFNINTYIRMKNQKYFILIHFIVKHISNKNILEYKYVFKIHIL
jgi:hypothetical protein